MLNQIQGIHHVTSMSRDAHTTDRFFTRILGLRRVKKTVNFDAPDIYHLYYGNSSGQPGSVMTYFPFPNIIKGVRGTGEVGETYFAVPEGALDFWQQRLQEADANPELATRFDRKALTFTGADGDGFVLMEQAEDPREAWLGGGVGGDQAIRGFHGAKMVLADGTATKELLKYMSFESVGTEGAVERFERRDGNAAEIIDVETRTDLPRSREGAGSVHHIAFAVADDEAQLQVRAALVEAGMRITPVIDRDYFHSIYFRAPGGVLFEIATNQPGFARDEDPEHLGEQLRVPAQHAHLKPHLEKVLPAIGDN
ncbi:VOC family protein [Nitratireductor basaltis]|uniref:Glyoxalase/bleomycin resistance protein/dioxygenase n=1 Tax=Nitratireductor basaltis TaxID=472175 RepID=A0A084U7F4_9HYPH|nr:VOC family protein [Nitratireductor basaltis]KFB08890.1 Glyoxalase/bleomycin resistance protein/dioxygenase [Nitratireductor basaltis]